MKQVLGAVSVTALLAIACSDGAVESDRDELARGEYLVERVGMCADCHSPRNPDGSYDRERWLTGSPIGFKALAPMPWAPAAPGLAGLDGFTDEQVVAVLSKGIARTGNAPLPPMPEYRLSEADARAVIR